MPIIRLSRARHTAMHAFVCDSSDATGTTEPKAGLRVLAESPTLEDAAETFGINVSTASGCRDHAIPPRSNVTELSLKWDNSSIELCKS